MRRRLAVGAGVLVGAVAGVALLAALGLRLAVPPLQAQLAAALGPRATVGSIRPGWTGLELLDLRVRAAPGWPAPDELRAARVLLVPDWRSLFGGPWRLASVQVDQAYLSLLRNREGNLLLLPALLGRRADAGPQALGAAAAPTRLVIGDIVLREASVAVFDASVRQPPLALHMEQLDVQAGPVALPDLDRPVRLHLAGVFKGPQQDGRLAIDGEITPATRDAQIRARFQGVDLKALQPYLLKGSDTSIRRGALDLELHATVAQRRLRAPGQLTLTNLELGNDGALAGVPLKAVLAAMTERGRIEVKFNLEGRLDDPGFSINENLAAKVASGLADSLGVSLSGVVKGLGGVVKGLLGR
jgi:hypothetical protein